ncbi:MAG: cell division protein FtsA [Candidatus Yonathbacteria bacterium]|nr:cell division protein FtsA [Candidatus Yonathbacteria bacterium]
MARNIITGIDVGTHTIRVVISELIKGNGAAHIIGTGLAESKGLRHGYIVNDRDAVESISAAIAAAEKSSGITIKSAYLSIGGISLESFISTGTTVISRADSEVTDLDIEKISKSSEDNLPNIQNKKIIDTIFIKYKLDGKEVLGKPQGMKGTKLEVKTLFITCLEQHLNDLVHVVEEAGVDVDAYIAAPIAASLIALSKKQRVVGCVLVNLGAETVSLVVFDDDIPISLQVFPIGSTDITNDIALGLKIPLEEAERLKLGNLSDNHSKKKLDEIIEARLSDIFELVEAHLKKIGRNELLPAGVIITGGGAGIGTIEDLARATLKLPSRIATPLLLTNQKGQVRDSSWFVAYGLCVYGFMDRRPSRGASMGSPVWGTIKGWLKELMP